MNRPAILPALLCPLLLLWSCGTGQNDGHDHPHEAVHEENSHLETAHENEDAHAEEAHAHSDEIVISPEKAEAAGITVETVEFRNFASVIRTGGQILPALGIYRRGHSIRRKLFRRLESRCRTASFLYPVRQYPGRKPYRKGENSIRDRCVGI